LRAAAAVLVLLWLLAGTAGRAEQLVSTISNPSIAVTSNFNGESLSFFGNVEPDPDAKGQLQGPYDVVIVIIGPSTDRAARLKTNELGLWMNTRQVVFHTFPTYYQLLASGPLERIVDPAALEKLAILPEDQPAKSAPPDDPDAATFGQELTRLMQQKGLFGVNEGAVKFLSATTYEARLQLPGNIQNGLFITQTYLFKNGQPVAQTGESFSINTTGFERFVGATARENPVLYGLISALLAIGTGWLGGVLFKR
jgi:uncharacterized protein (TIGR02186 family)